MSYKVQWIEGMIRENEELVSTEVNKEDDQTYAKAVLWERKYLGWYMEL